MKNQAPQPAGLDTLILETAFILFRHKWKIIIFAFAGVAAAMCIWGMTPMVYQSEARLLVRYVAETTEPSVEGGKVADPDRLGANIINSEIAILTSMELLGKVVEAIGPKELLPEGVDRVTRDAAVLALRRSLSTVVGKRSSVINVFCTCRRPDTAQNVLSELIRLYLEKHIQVHRSGLDHGFLSQQTDQAAARLAETEEELQAAKQEAGVTDLAESKAAIALRIAQLNEQVQETETELAVAVARLVAMIRPVAAVDGTNASSEVLSPATAYTEMRSKRDAIYSRLVLLREREVTLLLTYTEQSPPVQNIRREIAKAEAEWQSLPPSVEAPRQLVTDESGDGTVTPDSAASEGLMNERANIAAMEERLKVVKRYLAKAEKKSSTIDRCEARIQNLARRKEIDEANYLHFSKCLEQARVNDALDSGNVSNISVVQGASHPLMGMRRNLMRNVAIAIAFGLFAGVGLAFVTEKGFNARYFARASELRKALGLPVLVTIPQVGGGRFARRGKMETGSTDVQVFDRSPIGDRFGAYCAALQQRVSATPPLPLEDTPVLGVVGCATDAGVSMIVSGIAVSLAKEENARVLIVSPSLDHAVKVTLNSQGKISVLDRNPLASSGDESATKLPQVSGPVRKFKEFLENARQGGDYDFIVVDLPPMGETGPAAAIAALLDSVIFVVQAEEDQRTTVQLALERLGQTGAKVIGAVFNRRRTYGPKWLMDGM